MTVKNIFDKDTLNETVARINTLTPGSRRQWGKMDVAQMLAHLTQAAQVPLLQKPLPRMFIGRLIGWAAKAKLYDESPMAKNLPTAKEFKITAQKNIGPEKQELIALLTRLSLAGEAKVHNKEHPFFGKLTGSQWGKGIWKHVNHHLTQFGV